MTRRIAALWVFLYIAASLNANSGGESGALLIHSYSAAEYNANIENWSMVQDSRGVMFFANNEGVLEFDGATWRKIAVTGQHVRRLAVDSRGTIFVGGRGTFGYLTPDASGALQFVSLVKKVPPADRKFNDVWDILPTADGVYFVSYDRMFLYTSAGVLKVFRPPAKTFARAFAYHDEVYLTSTALGLLTIQHSDLTPANVKGDQTLEHSPIVFGDGPAPLIAFDKRLYRFTPESIDRFPTKADQYFNQHEIYSLAQLPGGDIAVGTKSGGLVLLDQQGDLERIVQKIDGLPSNSISSIYSDKQGSVWVTTDNGLARFPVNVTRFGEAQGIHGSVYAVTRVGGVLYVGTSLGLFRMNTSTQQGPTFTRVPEVQEKVLTIAELSGTAFVGTEHGLFAMTQGKFARILSRGVYDVSDSKRDTNTFFTAGGGGVQLLQHKGSNWTVSKTVTSGQDFYSVTEDGDGRVWATGLGSVWKIDFLPETPKYEKFTQDAGVPEGWTYVSRFRGNTVFASQNGLLKFSDASRRLVPDLELGADFANGQYVVSTVRQDPNKDIWVTGRGYHGILHGPNREWFAKPLLEAEPGELFWLDFDSEGVCWAAGGTSGSLIRYQLPSGSRNNTFAMMVRRVVLTGKEKSIFLGDSPASAARLLYRDNALRFEYAVPFFEDPAAVKYQFRLVGNNSDWSAWTKETRKDYTNLFEGKYTFEVRAQSPHGAISQPAVYHFSVAAPWYRSWWAYAAYVTGFLFAGWLILRWRLRALEAKNKWLEGVVQERTAEVRTERDQNEALLLNILPSPIASELRATGSVKPTSFDDVTVCFSDFVGFTLSSEKLPPQELISSLNEYFTAFDEIIGRYGLEKLKTIGDAYMFAGGLPNASPSHAVDSVLAALEMVEVVRKLARPEKGVNWSIRLGLYSGPVVAGVVGVRKFAFDIWGNTVNFAARMESAGAANRVNLSETTWKRVADFIDCESRGGVRIKEGREMDMYFALDLKPELLAGPLDEGVPLAFRHAYQKAFAKPPKSFPNLNGKHAN